MGASDDGARSGSTAVSSDCKHDASRRIGAVFNRNKKVYSQHSDGIAVAPAISRFLLQGSTEIKLNSVWAV